MTQYEASLFGRPVVSCSGHKMTGLDTGTAPKLLFYILLFCDRTHAREKIALEFWPDSPPRIARKNLRQALWQLGQWLPDDGGSLLSINSEWIGLNDQVNCLIDTAVFEQVFRHVRGVTGSDLSPGAIRQIKQTVAIYRGDLLEGWPEEWCLYERERFNQMYLTLLDKLVAFSEAKGSYEDGVYYGCQILRHDHAHERTHRRIMRMLALAGDRTSALHQFAECQDALLKELNVVPARQTLALYEQIRDDKIRSDRGIVVGEMDQLPIILEDLQQIQQTLRELEHLVSDDIHTLQQKIQENADRSSRF